MISKVTLTHLRCSSRSSRPSCKQLKKFFVKFFENVKIEKSSSRSHFKTCQIAISDGLTGFCINSLSLSLSLSLYLSISLPLSITLSLSPFFCEYFF